MRYIRGQQKLRLAPCFSKPRDAAAIRAKKSQIPFYFGN
jgi:hypothetical protein